VNFCEGFAQGAVSMAMQSLAAFRGAEAFLHAQPAAVPRCSAQRVREMGAGIAG
jgi:hypothetical protein